MIIRIADPIDDCLGLLDGATDFVNRMDWNAYIPKDPKDFAYAMSIIFTDPSIETVIGEVDGKIVSGLGMLYRPHFWNPKIMHAEEVFFWASKDAPKSAAVRMLKFVKNRALEKNVKILSFTRLTSTPDKIDKVYKSMGLEIREIKYSGEI